MKIIENYPLLKHNTFHFNINAKIFAEYNSIDELRDILTKYRDEKMLHIGAGSNLLFTDNFSGLVLHSDIQYYQIISEDDNTTRIKVGSGVVFDDFIEYAISNGMGGAENLSYIPGEVGASAVQNIGAYGVEAKDIIHEVEAVHTKTLESRLLSNAECQYAYRDSIFKGELKGQYIVTAVTFNLSKCPTLQLDYGNVRQSLQEISHPTIADVRRAIIGIRKQKLPEVSELGSAGSFFKNPILSNDHFKQLQREYPQIPFYDAPDGNGKKVPAAWLITTAGLKGKTIGDAQVYEKQPLVIVNRGNAKPQDIVKLAELVSEEVKAKFNVTLHPEVNYI